MFNWLWKRLITPERVGDLVNKARPYLVVQTKHIIHTLLADEEIAGHVTEYGDALFDRYKQKALGTIGGLQKGLNYAQAEEMDKLNPLSNVIDEEGNISLMGVIKSFVLPRMTKGFSSTPSRPETRSEAPKAT